MKTPIHELLTKERIKQNIFQWELAEKLGVTQSAISSMECGKFDMTFSKAEKIANALGKELEIKLVDKKQD